MPLTLARSPMQCNPNVRCNLVCTDDSANFRTQVKNDFWGHLKSSLVSLLYNDVVVMCYLIACE